MSDWYKFTEESLAVWPSVKLSEVRAQIEQRINDEPARYEANRADMDNKVRMLAREQERRAYEKRIGPDRRVHLRDGVFYVEHMTLEALNSWEPC